MKIAIWKTDHPIADTVAASIYAGFCKSDCNAFPPFQTSLHMDMIDEFDVHIGYGILRGMDGVFRACQAKGKPFIHLDKGYWKPGHFDGYYRVSLNGTQQTSFDGLKPDYERWDSFGIGILPVKQSIDDKEILVIPPTVCVQEFFKFGFNTDKLCEGKPFKIRVKDPKWEKARLLQSDLDDCSKVITFNSSVGWEALRQGIPVVSDAEHSIIGAWQKKKLDKKSILDLNNRRELFALMAGLQLTLEEIQNGKLWPLIQRLLST